MVKSRRLYPAVILAHGSLPRKRKHRATRAMIAMSRMKRCRVSQPLSRFWKKRCSETRMTSGRVAAVSLLPKARRPEVRQRTRAAFLLVLRHDR